MNIHTIVMPHFRLDRTFSCGQAFRWHETGENEYFGVAGGNPLTICQSGDEITLTCPESTLPFWHDYFALDHDYTALVGKFGEDEKLRTIIEYSSGIRILRQESFEALISFIISANNHVPRIRSIIEKLCARYGTPAGKGFAFPSPHVLARADEGDVIACGAGYRAPYIIKTSQLVADGFDLEALKSLPEEEARKALTALPGVGPKVAQCVMLFGLGFYDAFPVDVWMKRVLGWMYPELSENEAVARCRERFSPLTGVAQQLLFHYARQVKLCKAI